MTGATIESAGDGDGEALVARWRQLAGDAALVAAVERLVADAERPTPRELDALVERAGSRELAGIALELVAARRRARAKLRDADRLLLDRVGVEQASSSAAAVAKAERFARAAGHGEPVVDVCCGVGSDAIALAAAVGAGRVTGVDRSPVRAFMTERNAGCATRVVNLDGVSAVEALDVAGSFVHLDPARRDDGPTRRRRWRYDELQPGPEVLEALIARAAGAALKLGPGVAFDELPDLGAHELEVVGVGDGGRTLEQAVVWTGALVRAAGGRTATRVGLGSFTASRDAAAGAVPTVADDVGRIVAIPDAALERAGLVGAWLADRSRDDVAELVPGLGILTTDTPLASRWVHEVDVAAVLPWRERKVQSWLADHDVGELVVRSRGGIVDASAVERRLRGRGERAFELLVLRVGRRVLGIVGTARTAAPGRLPSS